MRTSDTPHTQTNKHKKVMFLLSLGDNNQCMYFFKCNNMQAFDQCFSWAQKIFWPSAFQVRMTRETSNHAIIPSLDDWWQEWEGEWRCLHSCTLKPGGFVANEVQRDCNMNLGIDQLKLGGGGRLVEEGFSDDSRRNTWDICWWVF